MSDNAGKYESQLKIIKEMRDTLLRLEKAIKNEDKEDTDSTLSEFENYYYDLIDGFPLTQSESVCEHDFTHFTHKKSVCSKCGLIDTDSHEQTLRQQDGLMESNLN